MKLSIETDRAGLLHMAKRGKDLAKALINQAVISIGFGAIVILALLILHAGSIDDFVIIYKSNPSTFFWALGIDLLLIGSVWRGLWRLTDRIGNWIFPPRKETTDG